jgi:hypothetical protein
MLTFLAAIIALAGVYVEFNPRIKYDIVLQICIAFISMSAGGFVVGQNEIALLYCIIAILVGMIYYVAKVYYEVMPQKVRK